ncbi:MAG: glycosyltransferase [Caldilineaceae bacterium]
MLNDYAQQTLFFDHPEVRIINVPTRFQSVGEKYKAAASLASHDLIFVWHDDDIYLPHRISYSVAHLDAEISFFKANRAWTWNHGTLSGPTENNFHGGSCWRRALFSKVQGYPHTNGRYDLEFEQLCTAAAPAAMRINAIKPADLYYLHRWHGTGSYHFSLLGSNGQGAKPIVDFVAEQAARGEIPQGEILLQPRWLSDYSAMAQQATAALSAEQTKTEEEIPFPPPYHEITPPPPLPADQAAQLFRGDYPCKISVILPAANESVLLQRTVEQFAATLPENSEIIVVDNGSTDGCSDFLLENCPENIHLIRTPDALGVAGARNHGLAQAKGEIVVFADAHIDIPKRWWEPLVDALNQPKVGIVGPGIGVMGKPNAGAACGQRIAEAKLRVEWLSKEGEASYAVPTLGGGFMVMRHDTLKAAGAFDEGMPQWGSEDLEICLRYWLLGYEVWVAPSVTILHYFRTQSPYKVEWRSVAHNLLRVALLHLNGERLTRVLAALKGTHNFEDALAHAITSDVWSKRIEFAKRRTRDDDWLFEKFADTCPV